MEHDLLRDDSTSKHSVNKNLPDCSERLEVYRKLSRQRTYPSGERIFLVMIIVVENINWSIGKREGKSKLSIF